MVLKVSDISKSFGKLDVLTGVNLEVKSGECLCIIGKNGSGKSTLINMIVNLIEPDSGEIFFWEDKIDNPNSNIKSRIGVVPEFNPVIDEFNLQDYLEYVGVIYGLGNDVIERRSGYLIDFFFDEAPGKKKTIGQFSKGMKLKAGICAALIHKPELVILDEPFDGLDMVSANHLITFLKEYRQEGNAVFLSSHDMLFVEKIATHVSLIKGTEVLSFSISDFKQNGRSFEEQVSSILGYNPKELKPFE